MFSCKRCGYATPAKDNLIRHLNRKEVCPAIHSSTDSDTLLRELEDTRHRPYVCDICKKGFLHHSNLSRHKKNMHSKVIDMEQVTQLIEKQNKKIQELEERLTQRGASSSSTTNIHGNVNQGTINHITNNIQINALGREDISYLTEHPRFKEFMIKCVRDKVEGVCEYIVKKHFHPDHPENHNIKKLNRKDDFMECYDGRKWKVRFCEDVLDDIFIHLQKDFADFVDNAVGEEGFRKMWLDNFMNHVGAPLDWDLSNDNYEHYSQMSPEQKQELRSKIYKLACEYIYRHSKTVEEKLKNGPEPAALPAARSNPT